MPDGCLGRSIAPRGSSRSNCQVKAILHGVINDVLGLGGIAPRVRPAGLIEGADIGHLPDACFIGGVDAEGALVLGRDHFGFPHESVD